jgi:phosphoserine / homoserine phosphotransferase
VQRVVTLDMEGVLTPEIWIAVATHTGVDELRVTTRDEPDYQKLMDRRIEILRRHDISLGTIQSVIRTLPLLDGARDFLDELRSRYQVVLLSDTFEQFAGHFVELMGRPHLLCHRLDVEDDRITAFRPRIGDPKLCAVHAYRSLNFHVTAAGDSHNDVTMLQAAHAGCLFSAPASLPPQYPDLAVTNTYDDLLVWIDSAAQA